MGRPEYLAEIKKRITSGATRAVYVTSDFSDLAEVQVAKVALARLENDGIIRRILRGVYERPEHSDFLQEFVAPDPDKIAHAIARNFGWIIVPCENAALNMLGLSAQVPTVWSYVSDGSYKSYAFNNVTLKFKHTNNKEIAGLSPKSALVIQTLKTLGHDGADKVVDKLRSLLTATEKRAMLIETQHTTAWVYEIIKKVCE